MSFFDKVFDIIAWIRIFSSPFLVGLITGLLIWFNNEEIWYKLVSAVPVVLGIAGGIYFAERARKKFGAQEFLSGSAPEVEIKKKLKSDKDL